MALKEPTDTSCTIYRAYRNRTGQGRGDDRFHTASGIYVEKSEPIVIVFLFLVT